MAYTAGPIPFTCGVRENRPPRFRQSRAPGHVAARDVLLPLPEGEGKGEGEPDLANQNGRTNLASPIRPAPEPVASDTQKQISRHALRTAGVIGVGVSSVASPTAAHSSGRENRPPRFRQPKAPGLVAARDVLFPLLEGEGKGEWEPSLANQNGRTNLASPIRPAPRAGSQ